MSGLPEANKITLADDERVKNRDAEAFSGLDHLCSQGSIIWAGGEVSRGVIVSQDDSRAVLFEDGLEGFSGVKQTFMLCADTDDFYG